MTEVWDETFARVEGEVDESTLGLEEPEEELPSEALVSLLNLGQLSKEIVVRGHKVRLRTLTMGEELEIGPLIQRYTGTPEEGRAYACAIVSSAIVTIDDLALVEKLAESSKLIEQQKRFDIIRSKFYWPIIEEIYEEYIDLQAEQLKAIQELQSK